MLTIKDEEHHSRKESTNGSQDVWPLTISMAGKILNLRNKGTSWEPRHLHKRSTNNYNNHICKNDQALTHYAQALSYSYTPYNQDLSRSPSPQPSTYLAVSTEQNMPIEVFKELRTWFTKHGLGSYLHILETIPHPKHKPSPRRCTQTPSRTTRFARRFNCSEGASTTLTRYPNIS